MSREQQALAKIIVKDPAVDSLSSFIGIDGTNTTLNSGRIQINLKLWRHSDLSPSHLWDGLMGAPNWTLVVGSRTTGASDIIRRLQTQLEKGEGITLFLQ